MRVLCINLWFILLLKLISLSKAYNDTAYNDSAESSTDRKPFSPEMTKSLKDRLNQFGSVRLQKTAEDTGSQENAKPPTESPLESFVNLADTEKHQPKHRDHKPRETVYAGSYAPKTTSSYDFTNFENFLSKQKKEYLEKCTKNPHDFVLLVDESGSISTYNWTKNVKEFVLLITSAVAHMNSDNNLSIVQYSQSPTMVMNPRKLNKATYSDVVDVVENMFSARRTHGTTYTGRALEFVREKVLDPDGLFVLELSESTAPQAKANKVVILFTDGGAKDASKALEESLIARFNGAELFIFGVGTVKVDECRKLVGCPSEGPCKNFFHAQWNSVIEYLQDLVLTMCKDTGHNATCLDKWSDFTECSAPCGGGTKTSKLIRLTTLSEATQGKDGTMGLTCEEQFKDMREKVVECNMFPCPENLVDIHDHEQEKEEVPEDEQEVSDKLKTKVFGDVDEDSDEDEDADSDTSDSPPFSEVLREMEEEDKPKGQDLTQDSHTTEPEVNPRTHSRSVDADTQTDRLPFHLIGGREHKNARVERLMTDEEAERMERKRAMVTQGTQTPNVKEQATQTPNVREMSTQTPTEEPRDFAGSLEPIMETGRRHEPRLHDGAYHLPHPKGPHHERDQEALKLGRHVQNMRDAGIQGVKNVGVAVSSLKEKLLNLLQNSKVKKLVAVAIVILLSALSISVFSYIFLREKEPVQNPFEPDEHGFINAVGGDDGERAENFEVSNMEDGIWA